MTLQTVWGKACRSDRDRRSQPEVDRFAVTASDTSADRRLTYQASPSTCIYFPPSSSLCFDPRPATVPYSTWRLTRCSLMDMSCVRDREDQKQKDVSPGGIEPPTLCVNEVVKHMP